MTKKDWLKVYLITDCSRFPKDQHLNVLEAALKGGIRDLQLREKNLPLDDLFSLAMVLRQMTSKYGARLYINDRLDIALMVDADGVHLPEQGLAANEVKARYPHLLVGVSTHSLESAQRAEKDGADFITFSPIFDTPSKREYGPPQGLDKLAEVTGAVKLPVLALGGINLHNLPDVCERGAHGAALISGIWGSQDIETEAMNYIKYFGGNLS
jgi:thiamine-phosphate pyrophosphorylase